jgi:hypothetical protein
MEIGVERRAVVKKKMVLGEMGTERSGELQMEMWRGRAWERYESESESESESLHGKRRNNNACVNLEEKSK